MRIQLRHLSGALAGRRQEVTLEEGQALTVGRDAGCGVKLHQALDETASGLHARLLLADGRVAVEDQRSTNGTFVDGARCPPFEKVFLTDGARLRLGVDGPELQLSIAAGEDSPAAARPARPTGAPDSATADARPGDLTPPASAPHGAGNRAARAWLLALALLAGALAALGIWRFEYGAPPERPAGLRRDAERPWQEVRSRIGNSVASVTSRYRVGPNGNGSSLGGIASGSGVLLEPTLVLTSSHLVRPWRDAVARPWEERAAAARFTGALESLSVQLPGQEPVPATLFAISGAADLALLQIPARPTAVLRLANPSTALPLGAEVAVLLHEPAADSAPALTLVAATAAAPSTAAAGSRFLTARVAHVERSRQGKARQVALDRSAATTGGGGAVVNRRGELVGLTRGRFAAAAPTEVAGETIPTRRYAAGRIEIVPVEQIADFLARVGAAVPPADGTGGARP